MLCGKNKWFYLYAVEYLIFCRSIITSGKSTNEKSTTRKSIICLTHQLPLSECPPRNLSTTQVKALRQLASLRQLSPAAGSIGPADVRARAKSDPKSLTEAEWQSILTPDQFRILRKSGTEFSFSHPYDKLYQPGVYVCAGCGNPLYSSNDKYNSGTGWPSFRKEIKPDALRMTQEGPPTTMELKCARCDGHLGHRFDEGKMRHCINGVALQFLAGRATLQSLTPTTAPPPPSIPIRPAFGHTQRRRRRKRGKNRLLGRGFGKQVRRPNTGLQEQGRLRGNFMKRNGRWWGGRHRQSGRMAGVGRMPRNHWQIQNRRHNRQKHKNKRHKTILMEAGEYDKIHSGKSNSESGRSDADSSSAEDSYDIILSSESDADSSDEEDLLFLKEIFSEVSTFPDPT